MRESEPGYVTGSVELAVRPFSRPVTFLFFLKFRDKPDPRPS